MKTMRGALAAGAALVYVGAAWFLTGGERGLPGVFGAFFIVSTIVVSGFIGQAFRVRDERTSSLTSGSAIAVAILGVVFITALTSGFGWMLATSESADSAPEPSGIALLIVLISAAAGAVIVAVGFAVGPPAVFGSGDGDGDGGGWGGWGGDGGCDGGGDGGE